MIAVVIVLQLLPSITLFLSFTVHHNAFSHALFYVRVILSIIKSLLPLPTCDLSYCLKFHLPKVLLFLHSEIHSYSMYQSTHPPLLRPISNSF